MSEAFLKGLSDAGLVVTGPPGPGSPDALVWRARGVAMLQHWDELVEASWRTAFPDVVRNVGLLLEDETRYRSIFPEYENIVGVPWPSGRASVVRADNLPQAIPQLAGAAGTTRVMVSTGGLLRRLEGPARPLFRDTWIWPAFQVNQIVDRSDADEFLTAHRTVLGVMLERVGLASFAVRLREPGHYGAHAELMCTTLPTGRPTVLATSYLMSDRYRERLGVGPGQAIIDIGFTGKALAVAAMQQADTAGLVLPPALAPEHVAILTEDPNAASIRELQHRIAVLGIRTATTQVVGNRARWGRAWRRARRTGISVGLAERGGRWYGMEREHTSWRTLVDLPTSALWVELAVARVARNQLDRSRWRMSRALDQLLTHRCTTCRRGEDMGWSTPTVVGECPGCGIATDRALPDTFGRFY